MPLADPVAPQHASARGFYFSPVGSRRRSFFVQEQVCIAAVSWRGGLTCSRLGRFLCAACSSRRSSAPCFNCRARADLDNFAERAGRCQRASSGPNSFTEGQPRADGGISSHWWGRLANKRSISPANRWIIRMPDSDRAAHGGNLLGWMPTLVEVAELTAEPRILGR